MKKKTVCVHVFGKVCCVNDVIVAKRGRTAEYCVFRWVCVIVCFRMVMIRFLVICLHLALLLSSEKKGSFIHSNMDFISLFI